MINPTGIGYQRRRVYRGCGSDKHVRLSAGQYETFVVRLWSSRHTPDGDGAGTTVRGQITHVSTHQTLRFTDLNHILTFIQAHLDRLESAGRPGVREPADLASPAATDAAGDAEAGR